MHSRSNYAQFLHLLSASRRFTLNQLGNEGAREFFWKWQALLQDMEHFDSTRANVEGIKAHGGKRRPDNFADREIISPNESHLLRYLYSEACERTKQDDSELVVKGVDPRGTMRTQELFFQTRESNFSRTVKVVLDFLNRT